MSHESHSWQPRNLAELDNVDPVKPTIGGLLYAGKVHVFSGEPETLKSLVAYVLAVLVLRDGGSVLLVDFEMGERDTVTRFRELGATDDEIGRLLYIAPAEPITSPGVRADVDALIAERKPELVILDSSTVSLELHGCDAYKGADIQRHHRIVIEPLRAHGGAVVSIDHVPKDKEKRGKFSIGSERKIGVSDVHLSFENIRHLSRGGDGLVRLSTLKDRGGFLARPRAAEVAFTSEPGTHQLTWEIRPAVHHEPDAYTFRPTVLMERVSRFVEIQAEPVSRKQVEGAVPGRAEYLRLALDVLRSEGYIAETAGTRGARLVESVRPFREGDLVPTSSRSEQADLVPDLVPGNARNRAGSATSSDLVPTSSPTSSNDLVPAGVVPYRGTPLDGTRSNGALKEAQTVVLPFIDDDSENAAREAVA